jgi:ribonucleoside-diphosphate reductase beta chain
MKILREKPEEGFQDIFKQNEQKIYDAYGVAVESEKKWAEYLFSEGSLLGLNERILGQYVEWLANSRLTSLGYKKIFDQPVNPIKGWLDAYADSKSNQPAPQEVEISSYKIGARDTEINEDEFEGFSLV